MCTVASRVSTAGQTAGIVILLCADPADLGEVLAGLRPDVVAPREISTSKTFQRCVAAMGTASHVIVDADYFDSDYRSNVGMTASTRYEAAGLLTNRLVFMKLDPAVDRGSYTIEEWIHDIDRSAAVGYMIITPDATGIIGRSIIPPPQALKNVKTDVDIDAHVRTSVYEYIAVFGRIHRISGTPFMQQDGGPMSCAHVSSWMVHYTAVLRGICSRRSTSSFSIEASSGLVSSRQYPSDGITASQIATVLEHFGLPVESKTVLELSSDARFANWWDRDEIHKLDDAVRATAQLARDSTFAAHLSALPPGTAQDAIQDANNQPVKGIDTTTRASVLMFWIKENLTSGICQYLNSGFPSIVVLDQHSRVVTGYLRAKDFDADHRAFGKLHPNEVVAFIVSDDQRGPYEILYVDEIVTALTSQRSVACIITPLAPHIWVNGLRAEEIGAKAFRSALVHCLKAITDPAENCVNHVTDAELKNTVARITEVSAGLDAAEFTVRSYVVPSTDFKHGFSIREKDDSVATTQVRLAALPKFVWVVEIMQRALRYQSPPQPSVIGEIVIDATNVDLKELNALIVHVPGAIQVRSTRAVTGRWHITGAIKPYNSGRYHSSQDWMSDASATCARWKTATP